MGQRRAPGVEHGYVADAGTQVLRVGGDAQERRGGGLEQDVKDHGLVVVSDVGDRGRQGKDHLVVRHRQELGLARGEPVPGGWPLALRTMTAAAGVVGDLDMVAVLAGRHMAAEGGRAALLDRCEARRYARITLSWPRLRCPALAWRQAGPWARKISATSSLSRDTRPRL